MKIIPLLVSLMVLLTTAYSQQYHKMIRNNVYWDDATYVSPGWCYSSVGRMEFIDGDSLIEGQYYRLQLSYPFIGNPIPGGMICPPYTVDTNSFRSAVLREDTIERKVYIYDPSLNPHDHLIYDFSLSPGDTLESDYHIYTFVLDTIVDVTLLNGEIRRKFCFDPYCTIYYIESIGGWQGLTYPIGVGLGFGGNLLCVKENNQEIWGSQCDYFFVGIDKIEEPKVSIYPNPTSDWITIDFSNGLYHSMFTLYNQCGKIIYSTEINERSTKLHLPEIQNGIYYYTIVSSDICTKGKLVFLKGI